jgi:hypothetical protein
MEFLLLVCIKEGELQKSLNVNQKLHGNCRHDTLIETRVSNPPNAHAEGLIPSVMLSDG